MCASKLDLDVKSMIVCYLQSSKGTSDDGNYCLYVKSKWKAVGKVNIVVVITKVPVWKA